MKADAQRDVAPDARADREVEHRSRIETGIDRQRPIFLIQPEGARISEAARRAPKRDIEIEIAAFDPGVAVLGGRLTNAAGQNEQNCDGQSLSVHCDFRLPVVANYEVGADGPVWFEAVEGRKILA